MPCRTNVDIYLPVSVKMSLAKMCMTKGTRSSTDSNVLCLVREFYSNIFITKNFRSKPFLTENYKIKKMFAKENIKCIFELPKSDH